MQKRNGSTPCVPQPIDWQSTGLQNILPMRVRRRENDYLLAWMRGLMQQVLDLSQHQHTPLLKLQDWHLIPRDQPFAQSYLVFQNATSELQILSTNKKENEP